MVPSVTSTPLDEVIADLPEKPSDGIPLACDHRRMMVIIWRRVKDRSATSAIRPVPRSVSATFAGCSLKPFGGSRPTMWTS